MSKKTKVQHVHKMVADTARAMCHEVYDALMQRNEWCDLWKRQNPGLPPKALEEVFIERNWGKCVPGARATLTGMLSGPYDQALKESIYDALILDRTLIRGRGTQVH